MAPLCHLQRGAVTAFVTVSFIKTAETNFGAAAQRLEFRPQPWDIFSTVCRRYTVNRDWKEVAKKDRLSLLTRLEAIKASRET